MILLTLFWSDGRAERVELGLTEFESLVNEGRADSRGRVERIELCPGQAIVEGSLEGFAKRSQGPRTDDCVPN
jgi:hypothetical protein